MAAEQADRPRPFRFVFPTAVGAAVAAAITYWIFQPGDVRHPVIPIEAGVIYRSGQLEPEQLRQAICEQQIKTVVNLGSKENWDEAVCREMGVNYVSLPVGDVFCVAGVPAPGYEHAGPPCDMSALWNLLDKPEKQPILIHCWGGIHRTGVTTAMYRIRPQGWRADEAIREMDLYGFESHKDKFSGVLGFLRTLEGQATVERQTSTELRTAKPDVAPTSDPTAASIQR